jgi:hypothetical protein
VGFDLGIYNFTFSPAPINPSILLVMSPATILERFDWSLDTLQAIQRFVAGVQPFQASKDGKTSKQTAGFFSPIFFKF